MRVLKCTVLLVVGCLFFSLARLLIEQRKAPTCEMTYMYSSYVPVPMEGAHASGNRYELYLYREDGFAKQSECLMDRDAGV